MTPDRGATAPAAAEETGSWAAVPAEPSGKVAPVTLVAAGLAVGAPGLLLAWWALSASWALSAAGQGSGELPTGIEGWMVLGLLAAGAGFTMLLVGLHRSLSRRDVLVALLTEHLLSERAGAAAPPSPSDGSASPLVD